MRKESFSLIDRTLRRLFTKENRPTSEFRFVKRTELLIGIVKSIERSIVFLLCAATKEKQEWRLDDPKNFLKQKYFNVENDLSHLTFSISTSFFTGKFSRKVDLEMNLFSCRQSHLKFL